MDQSNLLEKKLGFNDKTRPKRRKVKKKKEILSMIVQVLFINVEN